MAYLFILNKKRHHTLYQLLERRLMIFKAGLRSNQVFEGSPYRCNEQTAKLLMNPIVFANIKSAICLQKSRKGLNIKPS